MALSLAPCFSGVVFPVAIAMSNLLELATRFVEQGIGLGATFDRARLEPTGPIGHLIEGDDFQQVGHELFVLLAGRGLRDRDAELPHRIDGAFEAQTFHRHLIK